MKEEIDPILISILRDVIPEVLAKDICDAQPISPDVISDLFKLAKSEEWLKKNGYEPICESTRLMWRKK